jgi:hypothetical protein
MNPVRNSIGALNPAAEHWDIISNGVNIFSKPPPSMAGFSNGVNGHDEKSD